MSDSSRSPILPYHSQDADKPKATNNEKRLEISVPSPHPRSSTFRSPLSPPRTGATHRTGVSAQTGFSARTGASGWTGATGVSVRSTEMLDAIVSQLDVQVNPIDEEDSLEDLESRSTAGGKKESWKTKFDHRRAHLRHVLHNHKFHYTIIGLVVFDLVVVFIDLVLSLLNLSCFSEAEIERLQEAGITDLKEPASCLLHDSTALTNADWFLWALSVFLLSIFLVEILASLVAFGPRRFTKPLYAIDALVIVASFIMEIYFRFAHNNTSSGTSPAALVLLRLWKIVRAIHAIAHSIELKNLSIIDEIKEAKQQVEEEHEETAALLRRDQLKIAFLRSRLPEVSEAELETHAQHEIERENSMLAKEKDRRGSEEEK